MKLRREALAACAIVVASAFVTSLSYAQAPASSAPAEDCHPYNPKALHIQDYPLHWIIWSPVTTGRGTWPLVDVTTKQDLANAQALVERYSEICFVGRRSTGRTKRPNPPEYIVEYWKNPTGKTTVISPESCTTYLPSKLSAVDRNEAGWIVTDGSGLTLKFDNRDDAQAALAVAKQWAVHCTIGHLVFTPLLKVGAIHYWKRLGTSRPLAWPLAPSRPSLPRWPVRDGVAAASDGVRRPPDATFVAESDT